MYFFVEYEKSKYNDDKQREQFIFENRIASNEENRPLLSFLSFVCKIFSLIENLNAKPYSNIVFYLQYSLFFLIFIYF